MTILNAAPTATAVPTGTTAAAASAIPVPQPGSVPAQPQPQPAAGQPQTKSHADKAPEFHVLGSHGADAAGVTAKPGAPTVPLDQFAKQSGPDAAVQTAGGGVVSVHAVFQLDEETRQLTVAIVSEDGQLVRLIPAESVSRMITAMATYRRR